MKKLTALVLALLMAAGCFAACAEDARTEFVWMGYTADPGYPIPETDKVTERIEELFPVEITKVPVDWTSKDQISLYFAEGNIPDVMLMRQLSRKTLIDEELIREIPVEWLYEYMPKYMASIATYIDQDQIDQQLIFEGKCWGVPHSSEGYAMGFSTLINMTWAKNVGIDKVPETLEEYHDYCYKTTFEDPDGNGIDDTYGLSSAGFGLGGFYPVYYYYNVMPNSYYIVDGQVTATLQLENYKALLKTLAQWYAEGIIDPEFATTDWVGYYDKANAGLIATFTHRATSAYSADIPRLVGLHPDNEYAVMAGIIDQDGEWATDATVPSLYTTYPIYFGANTSDEKVILAMQILEALTSDPELVLLMRYCSDEEEVNYVVREDGSYAFVDGFWDQDANKLATYGYHYYAGLPSSLLPFPSFGADTVELVAKLNGMKKVYSGLSFSTTGANEAANELDNDLATLASNYALNAIMGRVDIDDTYDAFVAEWLAAGGQRVIDGYQAILAD